jgi:hypothetical protein
MKPTLQGKLRTLEAAANNKESMARYGPATGEVKVGVPQSTSQPQLTLISKDMVEAIFTMTKALQGKVKELQAGPTSENAAGLVELEVRNYFGAINSRRLICPYAHFLQAMRGTLRVMIGSMQEMLESVEDQEQDSSHRRSPDPVQDDDRSARRSTAKRRKIA